MKNLIFLLIILFTIKINSQCNASFTYSVLSSGTVSFTSTGNNPNGTSYAWGLGNGVILTGSSCVTSYSIGPIYNVTLSVVNSANSCTTSSTQTVNPQISSSCTLTPTYSFASNNVGTYTFQNTTPNTNSSIIYWSIDYNYYYNQSAMHTFSANGIYTISLNINDSAASGCYYANTSTIAISNIPCSIQPSFSTNSTLGYVVYGTGVLLHNQTTNAGPSANYTLNFGDGTSTNTFNPTSYHNYPFTGIYTLSLMLAQTVGTCSAAFVHTINILPCPTYTGSPTFTINNNGAVTFSSSTTSTNNLSYQWLFGYNGASSYGNPTTYNYPSNGNYTVSLYVTDSVGTFNSSCYATFTTVVSINNFTCGLTNVLAYSSAGYNGNAYFLSFVTYTPSYSSVWYFGDGNQTSSLSTSYQYTANGVYTPTFVIWDSATPSCSLQIVNAPINIISVNCPTAITSQHNLGANGLFNGTVTMALNPNSIIWNFGDGTYSYGANVVSHTYSLNGNYNVLVTINDSILNCSTFTIIPITISNASNLGCIPNSNFAFLKNQSQQLTWYAIPNFQTNITSVLWSWGDGTTDNILYPSHTYSAAGFYNVCLTVSLSCGNSSTTCNNTYFNKTTQNNANSFIKVNVYNPAIVSIKEKSNSSESITIYPIPTNDLINVSIADGIEINKLEIYNIIGETLITEQNKTNQIDVRNLSIGVYIITINTNKGIFTKKIIKE